MANEWKVPSWRSSPGYFYTQVGEGEDALTISYGPALGDPSNRDGYIMRSMTHRIVLKANLLWCWSEEQCRALLLAYAKAIMATDRKESPE